jgi:hypothetical protein
MLSRFHVVEIHGVDQAEVGEGDKDPLAVAKAALLVDIAEPESVRPVAVAASEAIPVAAAGAERFRATFL